ncbi:Pro-Pol polyprotein [Vitis vinifera]|uniref:Pro-Pol polyprotein n=1 Tax=Vitis vinifera TaxID=29760 RepID=A0A438HQ13_VITVI|nr:Pro-Pol polyprotein [Vitis vinifera]
MQFHHQYRAPPPPRSVRQFTQLRMPRGRLCSFIISIAYPPQDLGQIFTVPTIREQPQTATTHNTRAVPPPPEGVHLIEFAGNEIFMMGWDGKAPQSISLYEEVAQPPPVDRPFVGIAAREEVQREDDEILRQLRTTQARISIWSLLASSSTHRDALVRALGQIRVGTATTSEGLIHMLTIDRATCIVFSDDDLPPEGSNHVRPLFIDVVCSGRRVLSVLLDNGSALNVCPLVTTIALRFSPANLGLLHRLLELMMGLKGQLWSSFNLLLGRRWIHEAGAIPSSLHQKVKFIHEGTLSRYSLIEILSLRCQLRGWQQRYGTYVIRPAQQHFGAQHDERACLICLAWDWVAASRGPTSLLSQLITTHPMDWVTSPQRLIARYMARLRRDRVRARMMAFHLIYPLRPYTFQLLTTSSGVQSIHPAQRGLFAFQRQLRFRTSSKPWVPDYDLPMDLGDGTDEIDMISIGHDFIPDVYTDDMDFIGIGRILDGASDSVDPPLSSDTMSGFVTRFDDISDDNNDMSIFEYLTVSQHFPLIALPAPTTHIYDVDDVGYMGDPLGDQPREIRIGSSLSPDERSRLIDLLRSYLDVFAWSYEDMPGLDPSIVQHHLPILPHARPVKQKLRRLHPRWSLQVKEEIRKQLSVGFLSVVEYPEWLANVVPVPKKDGKHCRASDVVPSWMAFLGYAIWLKNAGATYQRAATTLFHDMMHTNVETVQVEIESQRSAPLGWLLENCWDTLLVSEANCSYISRFIARLTDICEPIFRLLRKDQPTVWSDDCQRAFKRIKECLISPPVLVPPTLGRPLLLYLSVSDMALGCMRLRHYMTEYSVLLVSRLDPLSKRKHCCRSSSSLPISDDRSVDDDFPDEQIVSMTSITGWRLYFDDQSVSIFRSSPIDEYIVEYEACITGLEIALGLVIRQYIHLPKAENQFADALATLASMIVIPAGVTVKPLLIETRSAPAYYCLIGEIEDQIELPWYHDIYQFLSCDTYHALTSAWPFSVWGVDVIGKISPKSSSGHEYILVAIDYFTKWVESASYARLTVARVAKFIRLHIICQYGVPHELISDRGVHFRGEVDTLIQEYGIQHHRSSAYRPQTNGAVEAANKNIKRILRKMVETSRDCYPIFLVYGMEAVLPVEIEMRSLRIALEQHVSEVEWVQSRYDQLSLLDEKRLRVVDHAQAYQRKMTCAFRKRVRPRKFQRGDLVLKVLRGLISDPRGKFRPSWSGPYVIRDLTREGVAWLIDLDGNQFIEPVNVDQLKKFYA